jgi:hypothetical protein
MNIFKLGKESEEEKEYIKLGKASEEEKECI